MSRRTGLHLLLGLLFVVSVSYQARHSYGSVRALVDWEGSARRPFSLEEYQPLITGVMPEAEQAGLRPGDRIELVEGIQFTGKAVLDAAFARSRAGDLLGLTLSDGRTLSIRLAKQRALPPGLGEWSEIVVLQVLIPALCLLLGYWVAASRPGDPMAWLVLALLIGFAVTETDKNIPAPGTMLRDLEWLYETLCGMTWPIWMLLFGIYFPERLQLDRRWPWAKWIMMVPLAGWIAAQAFLVVAGGHSFAMAAPLQRLILPFGMPMQILGMSCVSVFFMGLGIKTGMTAAPDARRRLRLLLTGTWIGLTPVFLLVLTGLARGTDPLYGVPSWISVSALMMLLLFPLTLAYVIVVHRALDVRVVIRQGMRYAFARKGVQVLRVVLIFAILLAISAVASRPNTRQVDILRILGQGGIAIVFIGRVGEWLIRWTDRRFFREALDAERLLSDLSENVRTIVETGPLLATVAQRISESMHVPRVACLLNDGGSYGPAYSLGYPRTPAVRFAEEDVTVQELKRGREPIRVYLDDPKSWVNTRRSSSGTDRTKLQDLGTQLLLPLAVKERLPGFISLGAKLSEEPYSGTDVRLLQSVATQAALALENSRLAAAIATEVAQRERLNREVEIAREVQERLFPQILPSVQGLDYAGHCRPALGVGGDYFDFLDLSDGRFGVAIADVSGKGIGAALLMASLQASLRGQTLQAGEIARIVDNVNRLVFEASPDNRYATFFYGQYEPATRLFKFVNAGHCPPIILRANGSGSDVIRLKAGGTVIGLFRDSVYHEGAIVLQQGDLLVAYTDGISEALDAGEQEWGEARLIESAGRCAALSAADTIAYLMREADRFVAGADQHDDMTLVVLRVT